MEKQSLTEIIKCSCGIHNCCIINISGWAELAGLSWNECYRKICEMNYDGKINIDGNYLYITEKI